VLTLGLKRGAGYVHIFTASGSAIALLIVLAAIQHDTTTALWLGLIALIIDGTDGMLARRLKVKERIPWFDGARLDDIVDYLTYAFAPMVLLWTNGYLPSGPAGTIVAIVPLMASSYQFCRVDAKTDDHFFLGFPSYWNIVAFYTIVLDLGTVEVTAILLICSFLVFVPVCYLYPSRTRTLWKANLVLTALWHVLYAVILLQMPHPAGWAIGGSLLYLVYYLAVSLYLTLHRRPATVPAEPVPG
jgi:phosphatidylcholine synthase